MKRVPRVLYDYRVRRDSMARAEGLRHHRALLGLLVERHLPGASVEERAILTTVIQELGATVPPPLRYKVVDELSRISQRIPGLNRGLRGALGLLFRIVRKLKGGAV